MKIVIYLKKLLFSRKLNYKNLKLVVIDVDGVLTDGKLYYDGRGESYKVFDVKDGLGIKLLKRELHVAFLSGNPSPIIELRAKSLRVTHCFTGIKDKREPLLFLMKELNLSISEIAYVGDDLNDLILKEMVGIFACPNDAHGLIKRKADVILKAKGGDGAVREFADLILRKRKVLYKYYDGLSEGNV